MAAQRLEQDQHEERRGDGERDGERATLVVVLRQRRGRVVAALAAICQRWKRGGGEEDEASEEMQFGDLRKAKGLGLKTVGIGRDNPVTIFTFIF